MVNLYTPESIFLNFQLNILSWQRISAISKTTLAQVYQLNENYKLEIEFSLICKIKLLFPQSLWKQENIFFLNKEKKSKEL